MSLALTCSTLFTFSATDILASRIEKYSRYMIGKEYLAPSMNRFGVVDVLFFVSLICSTWLDGLLGGYDSMSCIAMAIHFFDYKWTRNCTTRGWVSRVAYCSLEIRDTQYVRPQCVGSMTHCKEKCLDVGLYDTKKLSVEIVDCSNNDCFVQSVKKI